VSWLSVQVRTFKEFMLSVIIKEYISHHKQCLYFYTYSIVDKIKQHILIKIFGHPFANFSEPRENRNDFGFGNVLDLGSKFVEV
jgi:hypothetical protein